MWAMSGNCVVLPLMMDRLSPRRWALLLVKEALLL